MDDSQIIALIGERPLLKRDRSNAKAIGEWELKLAALYPHFQVPAFKKR
jgi:hypothetical protein